MVPVIALLGWLHCRPATCSLPLVALLLPLGAAFKEQAISLLVAGVKAGKAKLDVTFGRRDPVVRQAVFMHNLSAAKAMAKRCIGDFAKKSAKRINVGREDMEARLYRYFMDCRRAFSSTDHLVLAAGASRFGGREQLNLVLMA